MGKQQNGDIGIYIDATSSANARATSNDRRMTAPAPTAGSPRQIKLSKQTMHKSTYQQKWRSNLPDYLRND